MSVKVGLVSLGCAKNLIDSEIMIGHLAKAGMTMTANAADADVVIVNTCSFIDASKHEALEAIYEMRFRNHDRPPREGWHDHDR